MNSQRNSRYSVIICCEVYQHESIENKINVLFALLMLLLLFDYL